MTRRIPIEFLNPVLTVKTSEAARMLSVSRKTIWRLIATGKLRKLDCGVIPVSELANFARGER